MVFLLHPQPRCCKPLELRNCRLSTSPAPAAGGLMNLFKDTFTRQATTVIFRPLCFTNLLLSSSSCTVRIQALHRFPLSSCGVLVRYWLVLLYIYYSPAAIHTCVRVEQNAHTWQPQLTIWVSTTSHTCAVQYSALGLSKSFCTVFTKQKGPHWYSVTEKSISANIC